MTIIEILDNEETRDLLDAADEWSEKAEAGCKIAKQCLASVVADLATFGYTYKG